jgi:GalNAc5-diNAcBac-PP-undecaprenol beta-1,3-glucosyltransferase
MFNFLVTVAITTYNRSRLLERAIQSSLDQHWPNLEVLVIDDGSTDGTPDLMRSSYPGVKYIRQDSNRGVCAARNRALREASNPWVVFLDDDDTLLPGGLARIAAHIAELPDSERYPVFQFARSKSRLARPFMIVKIDDYITGALDGDFVPVIRREPLLAEGLFYPEFRSSAESLLWWRVADKFGIPTWDEQVQTLLDDAPFRMMSTRFHIDYAHDHAELAERTLSDLGEVLAAKFPGYYHKRRLAAATYRLLAEDRVAARSHLRLALQRQVSGEALGLWVLSFLPRPLIQSCYAVYKRWVNGWKR